MPTDPLRHHGDSDAAPGLLDFAVNVRGTAPPGWLTDRLAAELPHLAGYPSAAADRRARETVAARHHRDPDEVLLLNGAAEAFTLIPWLRPRRAAVVHPSFTEPEPALHAHGIAVHRVLLDEADGFTLHTGKIPGDADLVIVGNPTNPTSRLHPDLAALARQGRTVLVDEAFADTVPGEPESLAAQRIPGVLVLRSLTKTFAIAGLRAGYLLGDPETLRLLNTCRTPWPVSSLAVAAVQACSEPRAVHHAARIAEELQPERSHLEVRLAGLGIHVTQPATAPFLLLRVPDGERIRKSLRHNGIAVRRGDTFPGLGPDHLRVAVRPPEVADRLVDALATLL